MFGSLKEKFSNLPFFSLLWWILFLLVAVLAGITSDNQLGFGVGFYLVHKGKLIVGPYQGTLGCLHIDFSKGVCGRAAREEKTQLVEDVHALAQGTAHIACDPNSQSEIVVPVFDNDKNLIAVFDVDSSLKNSFDAVDQQFLEAILNKHFIQKGLVK